MYRCADVQMKADAVACYKQKRYGVSLYILLFSALAANRSRYGVCRTKQVFKVIFTLKAH